MNCLYVAIALCVATSCAGLATGYGTITRQLPTTGQNPGVNSDPQWKNSQNGYYTRPWTNNGVEQIRNGNQPRVQDPWVNSNYPGNQPRVQDPWVNSNYPGNQPRVQDPWVNSNYPGNQGYRGGQANNRYPTYNGLNPGVNGNVGYLSLPYYPGYPGTYPNYGYPSGITGNSGNQQGNPSAWFEQQQGKTSWPELVGKTYEEAEAAIRVENPDLYIVRVFENSPVTADYSESRVRITVNEYGTVVSTPTIG